jgi:hypothetical protein
VAITPACFQLGLVVFHPVLGFLVFVHVPHATAQQAHAPLLPTSPSPPACLQLGLVLSFSFLQCSQVFSGLLWHPELSAALSTLAWHHLRHLSSLSFASNCPSALGSLHTAPSWHSTTLAIYDQPRLRTYHGAQFEQLHGPQLSQPPLSAAVRILLDIDSVLLGPLVLVSYMDPS